MNHQPNRLKSLTTSQQYIYEGLQHFGEEVSAFYIDAINILSSQLIRTKTNLLAHLAREIDGGLRDILSPSAVKDQLQKMLSTDEVGEFKHVKGHYSSILTALGVSPNSQLAKDWITVASQFAGFAHRHGAHKSPRSVDEFISLWRDYESVLYRLVGNSYAVQDRVKRLASYREPTKEIIDTLPNLFNNLVLYSRFFDELKQPGWLEPLYRAGYFRPSTVIPDLLVTLQTGERGLQSNRWPPGEYLKAVAELNQVSPSELVINFLTTTIGEYIDYRNADNNPIKSLNTNWRIIELIGLLPAEAFSEKHFLFLQHCLETGNVFNSVTQTIIQQWLPNLIRGRNQAMLIRFMELLMTTKLIDRSSDEDELLSVYREIPLVEEYWLYNHLPDYISEICDVIGDTGFRIIYQRVKQKFASQPRLLLYLSWNGSLNWQEDPYYNREISVFPVLLCANVLAHLPGDITALLTELLTDSNDQYVAKRIALYSIANRYDQAAEVFWQLPYNPFNIHQLDVELASIIQLHHAAFTDQQLDQFIDWLDTCDSSLNADLELKTEQIDQYHTHKIHRFYSLIRDTTHPKLLQKIALFDQLTGSSADMDSQDFKPVYIENGFTDPEPPLEADTLVTMTIPELVAYLTDFREADSFGLSEVEGLRREFTQLLMEQPSKYYPNLGYFNSMPSAYLSVVYEVATELHKKGLFGHWPELFAFVETRMQQPDYWNSTALHSQQQFWGGVIYETTTLHRLINAGLETNKEFGVASVPLARTILLGSVAMLRDVESIPTGHFPFNRLFNSAYGTGLMALIHLNLYSARDQSQMNRGWNQDIQKFFERELQTGTRPELYELLGMGLSRFNFIDSAWVKRNIDQIFAKNQPENWQLTFSAYVHRYEPDNYFYNLLKESGNYAYSLTHPLLSRDDKRMTVRHLMRHYIRRTDKLDAPGSLLKLLLKQRNVDWLVQVVHYFRNDSDRYGIRPLQEKQLRFLWRRIHKLIRRNSQKDGFKDLASSLSHWIGYLSELDDEAQKWLNLIIRYSQQRDVKQLIDYLYKFVNQSPLTISAAVLKLAQRTTDLDSRYSLEKLPDIVDALYINGYRQQADSICNEFGRRGSNLLADLYVKYNPI